MSVQGEIGPKLPPRTRIYAEARELAALADLARECAGPGPRGDLRRALGAFERMRAILGSGDAD